MSIDANGRIHVRAGVRDGGRFTTGTRAEADVSLAPQGRESFVGPIATDIVRRAGHGAAVNATVPTEDADHDLFTNRSCEVLALTVSKATGWPVVVIADGPSGCLGWFHAAVRTPDGRILDVDGLHSPTEWLQSWEELVDAYGADEDEYDPDLVDVYDGPDLGVTPGSLDSADPAVVAAAERVSGLLLDWLAQP